MTVEKAANDNSQISAYLTSHFSAAVESLGRLSTTLELCRVGLEVLPSVPRLMRAVARSSRAPTETDGTVRFDQRAVKAKSEIDAGFPSLHAFAVVALWSTLESVVVDYAKFLIMNDRTALKKPAFDRTRLRARDLLLPDDELAALLIRGCQESSGGMKLGVNRFEAVMEPFGLSGPLPESTKDLLFELYNVRNSIVHAAGKIDRRLKTNCPTVSGEVGSVLAISSEQYADYTGAAGEYLAEIMERSLKLYEISDEGDLEI